MADLYIPSRSYHRHPDPIPSQQQQQQPYSQLNNSQLPYSPQIITSHQSGSSNGSSDDVHDHPPTKSPDQQQHTQKTETKPQATFLTKLYAFVPFFIINIRHFNLLLLFSLLERPENHHMIRWDPAGEHIIVERPEQLALHVLPSIYRQSRFASFSRQLNVKHPSTSLDRSILSLKISFF
jgi:hypothetical protein